MRFLTLNASWTLERQSGGTHKTWKYRTTNKGGVYMKVKMIDGTITEVTRNTAATLIQLGKAKLLTAKDIVKWAKGKEIKSKVKKDMRAVRSKFYKTK